MGLIDIFQNQGGGSSLRSPLLLILGIPDITGVAAAPVISSVTEYSPYPATFPGGGTTVSGFGLATAANYGYAGGTGFAGNWTSSSGEVYSFLNLAAPNGSNNWTNWSAQDPGVGFFGIYVYHLDATLDPHGLFDVQFAGAGLPEGTIAIAYGERCTTNRGRTSCSDFGTPFTESGFVPYQQVPEVRTLALLGSGLLIAGLITRRRGRHR